MKRIWCCFVTVSAFGNPVWNEVHKELIRYADYQVRDFNAKEALRYAKGIDEQLQLSLDHRVFIAQQKLNTCHPHENKTRFKRFAHLWDALKDVGVLEATFHDDSKLKKTYYRQTIPPIQPSNFLPIPLFAEPLKDSIILHFLSEAKSHAVTIRAEHTLTPYITSKQRLLPDNPIESAWKNPSTLIDAKIVGAHEKLESDRKRAAYLLKQSKSAQTAIANFEISTSQPAWLAGAAEFYRSPQRPGNCNSSQVTLRADLPARSAYFDIFEKFKDNAASCFAKNSTLTVGTAQVTQPSAAVARAAAKIAEMAQALAIVGAANRTGLSTRELQKMLADPLIEEQTERNRLIQVAERKGLKFSNVSSADEEEFRKRAELEGVMSVLISNDKQLKMFQRKALRAEFAVAAAARASKYKKAAIGTVLTGGAIIAAHRMGWFKNTTMARPVNVTKQPTKTGPKLKRSYFIVTLIVICVIIIVIAIVLNLEYLSNRLFAY